MDRHLDNAFRSTQPRHGEAAQHQKDEALDGAGVQRSSTQKKQKEEEDDLVSTQRCWRYADIMRSFAIL